MTFKRKKPLLPVIKNTAPVIGDPKVPDVLSVGGIPSDVFKKIESYIAISLTPTEACRRVGINPRYLDSLIKDNRDNVVDRIEKAKLAPKILHLQRIHKAEKGWQSSAWFLERADRKHFGRELVLKDETDGEKQVIKIGGKEIEF